MNNKLQQTIQARSEPEFSALVDLVRTLFKTPITVRLCADGHDVDRTCEICLVRRCEIVKKQLTIRIEFENLAVQILGIDEDQQVSLEAVRAALVARQLLERLAPDSGCEGETLLPVGPSPKAT